MPLRPNQPMSVRHVHIEGLERTKADVIEHELQKAYQAETLQVLARELQSAARELHQLGVFESVTIMLDAPPGCPLDQTDLSVKIEEKSLLSLNAGTFMANAEVGAETKAKLRNFFGGAEVIGTSLFYGSNQSSNTSVSMAKPRFLGLPAWLNLSGDHRVDNFEQFSSFKVSSAKPSSATVSVRNTRYRWNTITFLT